MPPFKFPGDADAAGLRTTPERKVRIVTVEEDANNIFWVQKGEVEHACCYTGFLQNRLMMKVIGKLGKYNSSVPRPHQSVSTNKVSCLQYVCSATRMSPARRYLRITELRTPSLHLPRGFLGGPGISHFISAIVFSGSSARYLLVPSGNSTYPLERGVPRGWSCPGSPGVHSRGAVSRGPKGAEPRGVRTGLPSEPAPCRSPQASSSFIPQMPLVQSQPCSEGVILNLAAL